MEHASSQRNAEEMAQVAMEALLGSAANTLYSKYLQKKAFPFTVETVEEALESQLQMCYVQHESMDDEEDWGLEKEPAPGTMDSFGALCVPKLSKAPEKRLTNKQTTLQPPSRSCGARRSRRGLFTCSQERSRRPSLASAATSQSLMSSCLEDGTKRGRKKLVDRRVLPIPAEPHTLDAVEESFRQQAAKRAVIRKRSEKEERMLQKAEEEEENRLAQLDAEEKARGPWNYDDGQVIWTLPMEKLPNYTLVPKFAIREEEPQQLADQRDDSCRPRSGSRAQRQNQGRPSRPPGQVWQDDAAGGAKATASDRVPASQQKPSGGPAGPRPGTPTLTPVQGKASATHHNFGAPKQAGGTSPAGARQLTRASTAKELAQAVQSGMLDVPAAATGKLPAGAQPAGEATSTSPQHAARQTASAAALLTQELRGKPQHGSAAPSRPQSSSAPREAAAASGGGGAQASAARPRSSSSTRGGPASVQVRAARPQSSTSARPGTAPAGAAATAGVQTVQTAPAAPSLQIREKVTEASLGASRVQRPPRFHAHPLGGNHLADRCRVQPPLGATMGHGLMRNGSEDNFWFPKPAPHASTAPVAQGSQRPRARNISSAGATRSSGGGSRPAIAGSGGLELRRGSTLSNKPTPGGTPMHLQEAKRPSLSVAAAA